MISILPDSFLPPSSRCLPASNPQRFPEIASVALAARVTRTGCVQGTRSTAGLSDALRTGMRGWERCGDNTGAVSGHPPWVQGPDLKPTWPSHICPGFGPTQLNRGRLNCLADSQTLSTLVFNVEEVVLHIKVGGRGGEILLSAFLNR